MSENDDKESEWDDEPTVLDGSTPVEAVPDEVAPEEFSEQITRANDLAPVLEEAHKRGVERGCNACYAEGQEDAIGALRSFLLEKGLENDQTANIVLGVRLRLTKL